MLRNTAACKSSTNYVYDFGGKNLKVPFLLTFFLLLNFVKKVPLVPLNLCGAAPVHVLRRGYFFKILSPQSPLVPLLCPEYGPRLCLDGFQDPFRGDPAQRHLGTQERGVVIALRQCMADWLANAVGQQDA